MEHLKGCKNDVGCQFLSVPPEWCCYCEYALHDVIVAHDGWCWEFACLIGLNLSQTFNNGGKTCMGLGAIAGGG